MLSLIECLPSIDSAEVWQLDNNDGIRCIQGLAAGGEGGGKFYRSNERVNSLLHDKDAEDFSVQIQPVPAPDANNSVRGEKESKRSQGKPARNNKTRTTTKPPTAVCIPEGLVIRPKRSCGILAAAPFRDYSFKVGRSWIGADRLARGFALVLRASVSSRGRDGSAVTRSAATGNGHTTASVSKSPRSGGRSKARDPAAATAWDDAHGRTTSGNGNIEDGAFTARVAREVGVALACVRGREKRAAIRAQALKKLSDVCLKDKPSGKEAKEAVLAGISAVLPGCRAYIGVLQSGGHTLLYESATPNSAMKGRELRRGEGISLSCLDDPEGQIRVVQHRERAASGTGRGAPEPPSLHATATIDGPKPPNFSVGDTVEVWYASSWLPATVVRAWGHQCYDVRYEEFRETEAGVPGWRLREVVTLDHFNVKVCWGESPGDTDKDEAASDDIGPVDRDVCPSSGPNSKMWPWPFVCAPLRSAGNRVGILGVDGWSDVELGRPEEVHPEKAVVNFLREAGSLLADALYTERRDRGLSALGKTLTGQDTTQNGALEALIMLLRETVTFRTRIDVLETRAADPGTVYCRGTWEDSPRDKKGEMGKGQGYRCRQPPPRVFDVGVAPRVEELCLTPAQLKRLGDRNHRGGGVGGSGALSPQTQQSQLLKEITPYQREMHCIARDGPGAKSGLQAVALTTPNRRGEIVGRFQRLLVRAGGGRPSADGWYLIRVARTLPEETPLEPFEKTTMKSRTKAASVRGANAANSSAGSSEDGDIWLLSEMCRRLGAGFMAIASREQRALIRGKALDRVLNCCKGFTVATASSSSPMPPNNSAAHKHAGSLKKAKTYAPSVAAKGGGRKSSNHAVVAPGATGYTPTTAVDTYRGRQSQASVSAVRTSERGGKPATRANTKGGGGITPTLAAAASSSPAPDAAAAMGSPSTPAPASPAAAAASLAPKGVGVSTTPVISAAVTMLAEEDATATKKNDQDLVFLTPMQSPTPAETSDGRKGALVTLKDGRLAVLVHQGKKRVAVVEQPGGRQQTVPESEVCRNRSKTTAPPAAKPPTFHTASAAHLFIVEFEYLATTTMILNTCCCPR